MNQLAILIRRSLATLGLVLLLVHPSFAQDDLEEPQVKVGGMKVEDYEDQQQTKADRMENAGVASALFGKGTGSPKTNKTIGQLWNEYKRACKLDVKAIESNKATTGANGVLDAQALGQKVPLCALVKQALVTAETERVVQIAFASALAVCTTACIVGKTAWGWWMNFVCKYTDMAAKLADFGASMLMGEAEAAAMKGVLAVQNAADGMSSIQSSPFGGLASEIGLGNIGADIRDKASIKVNDKGVTKGQQKRGKTETKRNETQRGEDDKRTADSCGTIPVLLLVTAQHTIKKNAAKNVAADTLDGIAKLRTDPGQGAGALQLTMPDPGQAQMKGVSGSRLSKEAGSGAGGGNMDTLDVATGCTGGTATAAATFSCASSLDPKFPGNYNPKLTDLLDKALPPGFTDSDPYSPDELAQDLSNFSGVNFGPMMNEMISAIEAKGGLGAAKPESSTEMATYGQGGDREPASAEDNSLESMMSTLMGGLGEKTKEEAGPKFDKDLDFRYAKDPRGLADDPKVSLFRRVSYRYRAVDKRTGYEGTVITPPKR